MYNLKEIKRNKVKSLKIENETKKWFDNQEYEKKVINLKLQNQRNGNEADKKSEEIIFILSNLTCVAGNLILIENFGKNFNYKFLKYTIFDLLQGANLNYKDSKGNTMLMYTCLASNSIDDCLIFEIFEYLIKNKADINIQNNLGNTALHFAILKPCTNFSIMLLNNNADFNLKNVVDESAKKIVFKLVKDHLCLTNLKGYVNEKNNKFLTDYLNENHSRNEDYKNILKRIERIERIETLRKDMSL